MKKSYLLLVGLLASTLVITGCRRGRGRNSGSTSDSEQPTSAQPTSNTGSSNPSDSGSSEEQLPGFDPTWISDAGYTYSDTFPIDLIKTFLGKSNAEIKAPASVEGGCYYLLTQATEEDPASFDVVVDGMQMDDYVDARKAESWTKIFQTYSGYGLIDPALSYQVSVEESYDENYDPAAPTRFTFYKIEELWDTSNQKTSNTAWQVADFEDFGDPYWVNFVSLNLPFVALGKEYMAELVDMSFYRYFASDFFREEYPDYVSLCDHSLNDTYLDSFEGILTEAGFEKETVEGVDYWSKSVNSFFDIELIYGWGGAGNQIDVYKVLKDADYAKTTVDSFIADTIESIVEIPHITDSLTVSENVKYKFDAFMDYPFYDEDAEATTDTFFITPQKAKYSEFQAYANAWKGIGAAVTEVGETEDWYPYFTGSIGKVRVEATFIQDYDASSQTFSQTDGKIEIRLYGGEGDETPGFHFAAESATVGLEKTLALAYSYFQVDAEKLVWQSSATGVATVAAGVVTGVTAGTSTITVFEDKDDSGVWEEGEYKATITVTVTASHDVAITPGDNASEVVLNETIEAVKVGTSKNAGNVTIKVPAGTTSISFYAVAWKGASSSLSITAPTGVTVGSPTVSLTADDGASNNSPYTISTDLETFKHTVTLSGVTAETTITIASSARFIIWGATYC